MARIVQEEPFNIDAMIARFKKMLKKIKDNKGKTRYLVALTEGEHGFIISILEHLYNEHKWDKRSCGYCTLKKLQNTDKNEYF